MNTGWRGLTKGGLRGEDLKHGGWTRDHTDTCLGDSVSLTFFNGEIYWGKRHLNDERSKSV